MAADNMPMMLDSTMPVGLDVVDDLFGDNVPLPLPPKPHGRHLILRLDELRTRGCCQTTAWSRIGTIASISPDGLSLELRMLRVHPADGSWALSEPTVTDLINGTVTNPLVHLEWSCTVTQELAVFDSTGRVFILSFPASLNSPCVTRRWDEDLVDETNLIVGCHWLSAALSSAQKPFNIIHGPAVKPSKPNSLYSYESSLVQATGPPHHPNPSRSALFCLSMSGVLRMFWHQNNGRVETTATKLDSIGSPYDLVTHAAFAVDNKHVLIVFATAAKKMNVVKLEIQWIGPGAVQEKTHFTPTTRLNPSLLIDHLASINWLQMVDEPWLPDFTTLQFLPSLTDNSGKVAVSLIIGIRARLSGVDGFEMAHTIIDRWECVESRSSVLAAFEEIGNRRSSLPNTHDLPMKTRLKRLDPIVINKVVVNIYPSQYGKSLILIMSDGTVEYRDRSTLQEMYTSIDELRIMNLGHVGWTFSEEGPCYQASLSPTQCSMIQTSDDGKLFWSKLYYPHGDIGDSNADATYGASLAGLSIAVAGSIFSQSNFDDVLAMTHPLIEKKKFAQDWLQELIRILKVQVDYSDEAQHDTLIRNPSFHTCMSIMNSLGFRGENEARSFQSKFANVCLNIRIIVLVSTLACNASLQVREKMSPLDEPEVVELLAGEVEWSQYLLAWIMDSLFELMSNEQFMEALMGLHHLAAFEILQVQNNVALHLLFVSSSRSLLLVLCRRISQLEALAAKTMEFYRQQANQAETAGASRLPGQECRLAYLHLQQVTSSCLVPVGEFEKMLNVLGNEVKQASTAYLPMYLKQTGQPPPQGKHVEMLLRSTQSQMEVMMLLSGALPSTFLPLVKKLMTEDVQAMRTRMDPAKLFFADYGILGGLLDDKDSLETRREAEEDGVKSYYDTFTRAPIQRGTKAWRRCVRCAAVMENMMDTPGLKPAMMYFLAQHRRCICGGSWGLLAKDELVL